MTPTSFLRLVIVGRPNVGKSTLFNRLVGRRRALVHNLPGVTRDRLEEQVDWWVKAKRIPMRIVDTGGLGGETFSQEIKQQVEIALESADIILFLLDSQAGVTPLDHELLRELKQSLFKARGYEVPIFAVVNKVDAEVHEDRVSEFYELGLDQVLTVSAEHGRGIEDLKIAVTEELLSKFELPESSEDVQEEDEEQDDDSDESEVETVEVPKTPRIAVVGCPNVGKSTLVNALLGEQRMITSPIAGTTVDSIDSPVTLNDRPYILVDTAGIRRKNKTQQGVEVLSVVQTRKALENSDIALLLLDGERGITDQDEKIAGLIEESGRSVVLIMNKWDLQKRNFEFTKELAAKRIRDKMAFLKYAPIVFVSAKEGKGFDNLGDLIEEILEQRKVKIPTHEFTEWVRKEATIHNPQNAKFYLCHQTGRNPPTFVCHVNDPDRVHFSLRRHFVNALRERWGYMGSPVRIQIIEAKNRKSLPKRAPKPPRLLPRKQNAT